MNPLKFLSGLALLATLAPVAVRAQLFINLSPASVIGGSPVFFDSDFDTGAYQAGNIFNQQTGSVDMSPQSGNAWFPYEFSGSGLMNRFVTIDLGEPTVISNIEIFNSNQLDRGTLNFSLSGGNSVQPGAAENGRDVGLVLSSPVSLLASTSLTYSTANPVVGQSFAVSNPTAYRYLQLLLIDGQAQLPVSGLGLAEVRFSGAAVPEPEEYAAITGAALLGFMAWRRHGQR